MITLHLGRPPRSKTILLHPAWLIAPAGLLACVLIGLLQGTTQSVQLALLLAGSGLALLWVGLVAIKPEPALLLYTVLAINLNSIELPLPLGGLRVSPDIVLTSLLIVGVLLRVLTTRGTVGLLPISMPYLIFLAVPVVTLLWSPTTVESLRGIFRFVGYYALMWLIVDAIRTRRQVRHMVVALIVSLVIPIVTGFYQAATGGGQVLWAGALLNRIYGFAGGPFTLAYYLILLIPLLLVFFLVEREPKEAIPGMRSLVESQPDQNAGVWQFSRFWLGLLLVAAVAALGMTFIRGAWFALVVSLIILGLARGSVRFRQLVFTIPVLVVVVLVTFSPVLNRLAEVADPNSTFFGRMEIWKLAWDWITSSPLTLLAGVGMKAFEYYYILMAGPTTEGLYWRRESFLVGNRPHNELLGFTLDVGLIGTIAFIAVLVILIRLAVRVYRGSPDPSLRLVVLAFAIGATGLFVGAMGDNVFSQPSVAVYFWIVAGLVMAISRHMLPEPPVTRPDDAPPGAVPHSG